MKKRRVQREINDAIELFESSFYTTPSYDAETGNTVYSSGHAPRFHSVRKIKTRRSDYRPGPVKHYTAEEIEDYVKSKTLS